MQFNLRLKVELQKLIIGRYQPYISCSNFSLKICQVQGVNANSLSSRVLADSRVDVAYTDNIYLERVIGLKKNI